MIGGAKTSNIPLDQAAHYTVHKYHNTVNSKYVVLDFQTSDEGGKVFLFAKDAAMIEVAI